MSAHEVRLQLRRLTAERMDAIDAGLGDNVAYMRDLAEDLIAARAAYIGLAVMEIATLRAQLWGSQSG
jgi:uncharacterized MAPEG superfamily protein